MNPVNIKLGSVVDDVVVEEVMGDGSTGSDVDGDGDKGLESTTIT
jgi:hypothetical protein